MKKKKSPPSDAWNCNCCKLSAKHRRRSEQIKMRVRSTHKRVLRPVAIVAGWWDEGVFFPKRITLEGALLGFSFWDAERPSSAWIRCAHGNPRPACFVRVWALLLQEHACPFEQHGSSKRVAVCKVWRTRTRDLRLSVWESGRAVFQQDCRTGSGTGSAVERRSAVCVS